MAIGPRNKVTTTGLIDRKPMIPEAPVMAAQPVQQTQQVQPPTQAQVTPPVAESQDGPLTQKYPGVKDLSDEDIESLNAALSPSVKTALSKIFPDLAPVIGQLGSDEPNVIFPLSVVKRFAMQRYGGQDENEAVENFMADVIGPDIQQAQMETQNNVPPGTEQPTTETAGLMSSPQNMETV
jgi:hypothetical protein